MVAFGAVFVFLFGVTSLALAVEVAPPGAGRVSYEKKVLGGVGGRGGGAPGAGQGRGEDARKYQTTREVEEPKESKYYYGGEFKEKCEADGLYYKSDKAFVMCSNGYPHEQPCPPGTKTSGSPNYKPGYYYGYTDLCSVNLVDYGLSAEHYAPTVDIPNEREGAGSKDYNKGALPDYNKGKGYSNEVTSYAEKNEYRKPEVPPNPKPVRPDMAYPSYPSTGIETDYPRGGGGGRGGNYPAAVHDIDYSPVNPTYPGYDAYPPMDHFPYPQRDPYDFVGL